MDLKATALLKLIYLEMFGHDMSWASFHVLEVMSSPKYLQKRVGYLGAVQSFRPDTEVLMLATNLLKKDITSPSVPTIALPLVTLPHMITPSLALSLLADLLPRLSHSHPNVRKKTIVALYRLALVYPETLRPAWPKIKDLLMNEDEDPSVTAAVINVVCELGWRRPRDFLPLAPRLFELLVDGGNNWMAIKIIKLFATLTPLEPRLIRKLMPPLATLIRTTPAMSLLYECINGIIQGGILESVDGVREGEEVAALCVGKLRGMIIVEGDPNLKYVALLAFKKIVLTHADMVSVHQDVIIDCIDDQDISIRFQALDLSTGMVNKWNLVGLVERLMQQLRQMSLPSPAVDDGRSVIAKDEPAEYSDGEDPERSLHISDSRHESNSALPPEYRIATIKQILNMCAKDTYTNIADFEWYINILVQLVGVVPRKSIPESVKGNGTGQQHSAVARATGEEVAAYVGQELRNVGVRVNSVRSEAVQAAASLLLAIEERYLATSRDFDKGGALPYAAYLVGEYAEQLADVEGTLTALTDTKARLLPPVVLCAYLQAMPKLFACVILRASEKWTMERQTTMSLVIARMLFFLEPLTMSPSLEVQERAVELAELVRLTSQAIKDHIKESDQWPLLLTTAIPQLFGGSDLNPVAPSAQARVPLPGGLDLDVPLNSHLANLMQRVDRSLSPELEAMDFGVFYSQRHDRKSREAEPALERTSIVKPNTSSYQNTNDLDVDVQPAAQNQLERQLKNKDDPYYISTSQYSSGTSTPFHEIIRNTNGEEVDVDSIPIMDLDLGDRGSNNGSFEPGRSRPTTRKTKTYQIATDEDIETDDSSSLQRASIHQLAANSGSKARAHDVHKRSLLEVNSSGLGMVPLESRSSAATQLEFEKQESDHAEMARALQEVERLRLEMQRASERVHMSEGISLEGTLVKKRKVKMKKKKQQPKPDPNTIQKSPTDNRKKRAEDDGVAVALAPDIVRADMPIAKRKRRKPASNETQ
ncbi:MAG: hypothetical protein LQ345_002283 [Seirophora villosa]|nr:MAG: hypothetical protein LQ345_002283 [Seirophora villosa]